MCTIVPIIGSTGGEKMGSKYCDVLKRVLENSDTDLSCYGIDINHLTEELTFEEVQASLEHLKGVKIDLKEHLKSRKW